MGRIRVIALAAITLMALTASAAGAAPRPKLTLSEEGTALVPGNSVYLYDPSGAFNIYTKSQFKTIQCGYYGYEETGLELEVLTNSKANDELRLYGTTGELASGTGCGSEHGRVYPQLSAGGPLKLKANGDAIISDVLLRLFVFRGVSEICTLHGHLTGKVDATPTPNRLTLELGGRLTIDRKYKSEGGEEEPAENGRECPREVEPELEFDRTETEVEEQTSP